MKALIIGYGSIGQRHTDVLSELGVDVSIVSRHNAIKDDVYSSIEEAFQVEKFDYIVIANETAAHFPTLKHLMNLNFEGKILVEKPLFLNEEQIATNLEHVYVAYNLRYHPLLSELKNILDGEVVTNVNAYVGQYLPTWRPNADYSKGYSASKELGGGVLRDLSHELDYLMMLFGEWSELVSTSDTVSNLQIDSEDCVKIIYKSKKDNTQVSLELNYLDRIIQRYMTVQTNTKTVRLDFIANTINCNGKIIKSLKIDRNYTYLKQHEDILDNVENCCSFSEGLKVMKMINAIEQSSMLKEWVYND